MFLHHVQKETWIKRCAKDTVPFTLGARGFSNCDMRWRRR